MTEVEGGSPTGTWLREAVMLVVALGPGTAYLAILTVTSREHGFIEVVMSTSMSAAVAAFVLWAAGASLPKLLVPRHKRGNGRRLDGQAVLATFFVAAGLLAAPVVVLWDFGGGFGATLGRLLSAGWVLFCVVRAVSGHLPDRVRPSYPAAGSTSGTGFGGDDLHEQIALVERRLAGVKRVLDDVYDEAFTLDEALESGGYSRHVRADIEYHLGNKEETLDDYERLRDELKSELKRLRKQVRGR